MPDGAPSGVSSEPVADRGQYPGRRLSTQITDRSASELRSSISMESLILAQDERWRHA